jgi:hypothetical protein
MNVYSAFNPELHVVTKRKTLCMSAAHFTTTREHRIRPRGWYLLSRRAWKHARQVNTYIALMLDSALLDAWNQQLRS